MYSQLCPSLPESYSRPHGPSRDRRRYQELERSANLFLFPTLQSTLNLLISKSLPNYSVLLGYTGKGPYGVKKLQLELPSTGEVEAQILLWAECSHDVVRQQRF
ncbi:hypothetical protein B0O99DRAFT_625612 [Bisporella sp. PMI_857]|nr:hypothetical protein B0O99DRAFT_625612 [Bisporella sp. PMI_857]